VVPGWHAGEPPINEILSAVQVDMSAIPGLQIFASRPPALPGGGNFPVEFIITSTADPERMLEVARQLQMKAMESGVFYFPPQIDLQYDQPQAQITIDYQKTAALGLTNAPIGAEQILQ